MRRNTVRWLSLLLGAAILAAAVTVVVHISEVRELVRLTRGLPALVLLVALALQAFTYLAQGEVFRAALPAADRPLVPRRRAIALAFAKLFADQSLPSGGLSSTALIVGALERRRVPKPSVAAAALVNIATYHGAYVGCLCAAWLAAAGLRREGWLIASATALFAVFAVALVVAVMALAGHRAVRSTRFTRLPLVRDALDLLSSADPQQIRNRRVLLTAGGWQAAIFVADALTTWILLRGVGASLPFDRAFACFMIASVFRTIGVAPGGLGTFEATLVFMLNANGVPLAPALTATLLFRGASFWLPMLPGFVCARRVLPRERPAAAADASAAFWSMPLPELLRQLGSTASGLTSAEAATRAAALLPRRLRGTRVSRARILWRQFASPLLLLLVFAAGASLVAGEAADAAIVLTIVAATAGIGFWREARAEDAAAALRARIQTKAVVLRDGVETACPFDEVVPGDVIRLSAGSLVPADAAVLTATSCHINEAVLTGESYPVEKAPDVLPVDTPLPRRTNMVFLGTNVRSGNALCLVLRVGRDTEVGAVAARLERRPPPTEFDRGVKRFGYLLTIAMLCLVLAVFAAHMLQRHPAASTLLFSIALAVGLSPELLPAILTINLARGAQVLAARGVLVRRLNAIENLGSMDLLCCDKTGTLTRGVVRVDGAYSPDGLEADDVLTLAAVNAGLQTGLANPLDEAIAAARAVPGGTTAAGEIPFDFSRRRLTVLVAIPGGVRMITKGAVTQVLEVCQTVNGEPMTDDQRTAFIERCETWNGQGLRVIALATKAIPVQEQYGVDDEHDLDLAGFVTFLDRPKDGVRQTLDGLSHLGVGLKMITGDARAVAVHVAAAVGLRTDGAMTGEQLRGVDGIALARLVDGVDVFAEVDPDQKERIIAALRRAGHVVGFLGDGVNDAAAMHAADTSLSVDDAVDVARETADFVLLEQDLEVIRGGIEEGRRTFANTLKYILTTTSANLGNMLSMAVASLFLPFLPLLPGQILLNNFLSDIPAIGIAQDGVDPELIARPERWNVQFIGRFMVVFGMISSAFDMLTFAALLWFFRTGPEAFRTGWFVESLLTELAVALVVRTRRPFYRSRPGRLLLWSTVVLAVVAVTVPFLPGAGLMGFVAVPPALIAGLCAITAAYVGMTELAKRPFYGIRRPAPDVRTAAPVRGTWFGNIHDRQALLPKLRHRR